MIAPIDRAKRCERTELWQCGFLQLLPAIQRHAAFACRPLPREARAEAVQEITVHAMLAYRRLAQLGRTADAHPSTLTRYAVAHYRVGRRTGCPLNCRDIMSPYARYKKRIKVDRLDRRQAGSDDWQAILAEDRTAGPAEIAEYRIDVGDWLASLSRFHRRIARILATGETTSLTAKRMGLSSARVSQLRRELQQSWGRFQGDAGWRPDGDELTAATRPVRARCSDR